ncbi:MAG TPA: hypothetical protein VF813_01715, partial [Anaerolineaceae bacterium]
MINALAPAAVVLLAATSTVVLASRDWRWSIGALALQYIGVVILVGIQWPAGLTVTKLVVGWMTAATLGFSYYGRPESKAEASSSGWIFRGVAAGFVLILVFSLAPVLHAWLTSVSLPMVEGSLILIGIGLLQLGMTGRPFRVILGLLTFLSGFEILYSAVETSVLVAGLLAAVTLGLALV